MTSMCFKIDLISVLAQSLLSLLCVVCHVCTDMRKPSMLFSCFPKRSALNLCVFVCQTSKSLVRWNIMGKTGEDEFFPPHISFVKQFDIIQFLRVG